MISNGLQVGLPLAISFFLQDAKFVKCLIFELTCASAPAFFGDCHANYTFLWGLHLFELWPPDKNRMCGNQPAGIQILAPFFAEQLRRLWPIWARDSKSV